MTTLTPGANAALPPAGQITLTLTSERAHADLIVLCVRADGTADGDNGVALWSQPTCAGGAVTIDTATDTVTIRTAQLAPDVQRLLIVGQADGVTNLSEAGALTARVSVGGSPAATLSIAAPPAMPTVQIGEVYRHNGNFKVRCLGDGYADGLQRLLEVHGIQVTDAAPAPAAPAPIDLEKQRRVDILKKVEATGSVSLTKKVQAAAVSLDKNGLNGQRAEVIMVLDVSGSARPLFRDGRYQDLIERALATGLLFDDDGTIPAYLFDTRLHTAPDITLENFRTWAHDVSRRRDIWGGTHYAPPIEQIARTVRRGATTPTYVIFVTDGGNADRRAATAAVQSASGLPMFLQFMAVGRDNDFPFLQKLDDLTGREVDNADFFAVQDPKGVADEVFFGKMMTEFPGWIRAARQKGILG